MTGPELADGFRRLPLAHRGLHDAAAGRVENSLSAIAAAAAAGYGVEIDLQLSADGTAMVFHDDTLERLTAAEGPVAGRSAAELGRLPLIGGGGDTIPTLAGVLAAVAGRVPLLIEIKDQSHRMGPTDGRLEAAAAAALAGYAGPVAVMSFNPAAVAHMARLAPGLARGLTTSACDPQDWAPLPAAVCDRLREIPDYGPLGASFVSHEWADLGRPRVAALRAAGASVLCWTIRSPDEETAARRLAHSITFEGYRPAIPA